MAEASQLWWPEQVRVPPAYLCLRHPDPGRDARWAREHLEIFHGLELNGDPHALAHGVQVHDTDHEYASERGISIPHLHEHLLFALLRGSTDLPEPVKNLLLALAEELYSHSDGWATYQR